MAKELGKEKKISKRKTPLQLAAIFIIIIMVMSAVATFIVLVI